MMLPYVKTFSKTGGCVSSWCQSTFFTNNPSANIKCCALSHSMETDWPKLTNLNCVFWRFLLIFSKTTDFTSPIQCLSGQFSLCTKLVDEHIAIYVAHIGTLMGQNWRKELFIVAFLYGQNHFSSKRPAAFPLSRSHWTVSYFEMFIRKYIFVFVLRLGALINR